MELTDKLAKYVPQGNPRAARRQGAQRLTSRAQSRFPHATDLGDSATVVIRRQSGSIETYTIPWIQTGKTFEVGPIPSSRSAAISREAEGETDPLQELQFSGMPPQALDGVNGYGGRNPIFLGGLGSGFTRRLGGAAADFFYSGVFQFGNLKIGFIRIPNYAPPSQATAFQQFETEIRFMNANTDGLVIDEMRNTGGNLCFGEELARRLTACELRATGFELRAFWRRVLSFYNAYINAVATNQPPEVVTQYQMLYQEMLAANQEGRVVTKALPLCTSSLIRQPLVASDGSLIAYTKPIMVMIDDFSTSTADSFAGMIQDSGRALLYGMRSNGAGGNNTSYDAGNYSESFVGMTLALQSRKQPIQVDGFPATQYIENVGVRPQVVNDYMTKENLLNGGATFVSQFLQTMADYIRQQP